MCLLNLWPTPSAPEANVDFYDIVAAVGESQMNAMIPDVMQLFTFYSVCPASTATAERSFSQQRRIKSYLRNNMSQQRLVLLMMLSAYPEMVDNLNIDKLMDAFIIRNDACRNTFSM